MPDDFEFRVARHQEHVSCYSFLEHFLALNFMVAQSLEDPSNIGFYLELGLTVLMLHMVPLIAREDTHDVFLD